MTRRKTKAPAAPTAWCRLHERYMNDAYIHRRRCCLKGRRGPCLFWMPFAGIPKNAVSYAALADSQVPGA